MAAYLRGRLYFMPIIIPFYQLLYMKLHTLARSIATVKLAAPPCVFTAFNNLAEATSSVNLGAGTPSCSPPEFIAETFRRYTGTSADKTSKWSWKSMIPFNFLGRRTTPALNDSIANIYSPKYSRKLAADRNILLASGARDALQSTLVTLLSKGDEVILFDPSYEIYRNAILKTGAIPIGIPLTPKNMLSKSDILARKDPYRSTSMDRWEIDLELLERSITSKTKAIIINSPHNPTGKIFTHDEISGLASILNRYKNITVVDDRVYEHTNFDRLGQADVPDISKYPGMFDRTVSIFSGGKLLRVKGLMCGWIIAPQHLVSRIRAACPPKTIDNGTCMAVSESLKLMHEAGTNHLAQFTINLAKMRSALLEVLYSCKYDFNMWVPEAGYFVIVDVTKIAVDQKYYWDDDKHQRLPRDFAFCNMLCKEDGVAAIPCSSFFDKKQVNDQYVRFAFCKDLESIREAGRRMKQTEEEAIYATTSSQYSE